MIAERLNKMNYLTLGNKPFKIPAVLNVMRLFGRKPVKRPFVLRICSKCHLEVTGSSGSGPDRPVVCHRCQTDTVLA